MLRLIITLQNTRVHNYLDLLRQLILYYYRLLQHSEIIENG